MQYSFIDELKSRSDLLKDPEHLVAVGEKLNVFERIQRELSCGELGRQIDEARERQYRAYASCAGREFK